MRGMSGAGKSYRAKEIAKNINATICSADDFWIKNGKYVFDVSKLWLAHKSCQKKFDSCVASNENVIVDNTNLTAKDMKYYLDAMTDRTDYTVVIYNVSHNSLEEAIAYRSNSPDGKNIPADRITEMYAKFNALNISEIIKARPSVAFMSSEAFENGILKSEYLG